MTQEELRLVLNPDFIEKMARALREEWNKYSVETLKNPPVGFTKSWEDTGEWGREGNRRVAKRLLREVVTALHEQSELRKGNLPI